MKRLFLILLLLPTVYAIDCSNIDPLNIASAVIGYKSLGDINFVFNSQQSIVENLTAMIRVVPQVAEKSQESYTGILSIDEFSNKVLIYTKNKVETERLVWTYESRITLSSDFAKPVNNPVFPYPYSQLPDNVKEYVEFTQVANNSPEIQAKVNELLSGVTDYLTAVGIVSQFVAHYLTYDDNYVPPSTPTPSSQIFLQETGVCAEFSTLTVSMLRNVGIPARFVSGVAFTNKGRKDCFNFINHSWIEFYIPGHGWVPADPTYKEFFWVDSGHIPLYYSSDALTRIINASMLSIDSSSVIKPPDFDVELLSYNPPLKKLDFETRLSFEEVGTGDYVLLTTTITNPNNYWMLDSLYLATTKDIITAYNEKAVPVILPPNSDTSFYFILLTPQNIDTSCFIQKTCNLIYPVLVSLASGGYELMNLTMSPHIELEDYYNNYMQEIEQYTKQYTSEVAVSNRLINPLIVLNTPPVLSFDIQNIGNTVLNNVTVLIEYDEILVSDDMGSLFISEKKTYMKSLPLSANTGVKDVKVTVSANNLTLTYNASFTIVSPAAFTFTTTGEANYTTLDDYELRLGFSSIPGNFIDARLQILINEEEAYNNAYYFTDDTILLKNERFKYGYNTIRTYLVYNDLAGNQYLAEHEIETFKAVKRTILETIIEYLNAVVNVFKILLNLN